MKKGMVRWLGILASGLVLVACSQNSEKPFSYTVDTALKPSASVEGPGGTPLPLAAVKDDQGLVSVFIANQIVITPKDKAELDAFVARYGGSVVGTDAVPTPPAGLKMDPAFAQPTQYVVQLDPKSFSLDSFKSDAQKLKASGQSTFSSDDGTKLLGIVAKEASAGLTLGPNFVSSPDAFINASQERPNGGGSFDNAFNTTRFQSTGSKSSVTQAWQFVAGHGIPRTIHIAVIDGGFWLDGAGHPMTDANGRSDLPTNPVQYDFNDDDYLAGGANPNTCTGGSGCPWHGNGSAGTAAGALNNQSGAAGTGGSVADPWLFKFNGSYSQQNRAVRTATAWGADVISMSFGGSCDWWCRTFSPFTDRWLHEARDHGLVLVASAGNNNQDVNDNDVYPCLQDSVICVGALNDDSNARISYSNFGASVDIWATTDIPVMANATTTPNLANHNGTSASAPFIAGIAAMMKAMNPTLTSDGVRTILRDTGWADSSDSRVDRYVNAFKAVMQAAGNQVSPDTLEPNNSVAAARSISASTFNNLTIDHSGTSGWDYYRFTLSDYAAVGVGLDYMPGLGNLNFVLTRESSGGGSPEGVTNNFRSDGRDYHANLVAPGTYRLLLSNANPAPYNMRLNVTNVGLIPDGFEANNTFGTSKSPALGSYAVNLHQNSDVDFYKFVVSNPTVLTSFRFSIDDSDNPVNLTLFDSVGTQVSTSSSSFTIPNGIYTVKVEGAKGRYTFSTGYFTPPPPVFTTISDRFWWIDPGDPPFDSVLTGPEIYVIFANNERTKLVRLFGQGLHLSLLDTQGKQLGEGVAKFDGKQQYGEELSLSSLTLNQQFVLKIGRVQTDENPDGEKLTLPALPFNVGTYAQ